MLHKARNKESNPNLAITPSSLERNSRPPYPSNLPSRTSPLKFFASASTIKAEVPAEPQKKWKAEFLNDLRSNRPARPNGSRPQPVRDTGSSPISERDPPLRTSSAMSGSIRKTQPGDPNLPDRCASAMSHRRAQSGMRMLDTAINSRGRPLVQKPHPGAASHETTPANKSSMITPSATYRESGQRWMEKQEARSIREALEDMDLRGEESLYAAAQDEASELVWKHQHPNLPYRNPYAPYDYKSHLQKGSHSRSQSTGRYADSPLTNEATALGQQQASDRSRSEIRGDSRASSGTSIGHGEVSLDADQATSAKGHALWDSPQKKAYMNINSAISLVNGSGRRSSSEFRSRKVSGGLFRNPDDQIYEEPEDIVNDAVSRKDEGPSPRQAKTRNPISKLPTARQPFLRSVHALGSDPKLSRSDIHKNPPSQSRNPSYLKNALPPTPPDSNSDSEVRSDPPVRKNGVEVRGEDIRAATSMRLKDRSPKLPSPTVVSDRPGRPIVSFDQHWKPREINLEQEKSPHKTITSHGEPDLRPGTKLPLFESTVSAPAIPTINIPDLPSIQVNDDPNRSAVAIPASGSALASAIPSISIEETPPPVRPLPKPTNNRSFKPPNRPLPKHSSTAPVLNSKSHWSPFPSTQRATAQCAACAIPIAGRMVSASSQRFHPHCFTCHHCAAPLEHVAFYPEPSISRDARLARIDGRINGTNVPNEDVKTAEDDGDAGLRFYCHLDFHEHFSPRCRSCKTPIEGEVVVACGGDWHVGHFFCAQCGDPFDAKKPFVEREGYAWCVECHTRRFSGKCKGCRKPIVDLVVRALGAEWHENCFCCTVRRFPCQFTWFLKVEAEAGMQLVRGLIGRLIGVRRRIRRWQIFHPRRGGNAGLCWVRGEEIKGLVGGHADLSDIFSLSDCRNKVSYAYHLQQLDWDMNALLNRYPRSDLMLCEGVYATPYGTPSVEN